MKPDSGFDPPPSLAAAQPNGDGAGSAPSAATTHDGHGCGARDGFGLAERLSNYRKSVRGAPGAVKAFFGVLIEEIERRK